MASEIKAIVKIEPDLSELSDLSEALSEFGQAAVRLSEAIARYTGRHREVSLPDRDCEVPSKHPVHTWSDDGTGIPKWFCHGM